MNDTQDDDAQLETIGQQVNNLYDRLGELNRERKALPRGDAHREEMQDTILKLDKELMALLEKRDALKTKQLQPPVMFERSDELGSRWFFRFLPPLPAGMERYHFASDELKTLWPLWVIPVITSLLYGCLVFGVLQVLKWDWVLISPLALPALLGLFPPDLGSTVPSDLVHILGGINIIFAFLLIGFMVNKLPNWVNTVGPQDLREVQTFHSGSENWTRGQRAVSILVFAVANVITLLLPVIGFGMMLIVGMTTRTMYRLNYQALKDRKVASIMTAQFRLGYSLLATVAGIAFLLGNGAILLTL